MKSVQVEILGRKYHFRGENHNKIREYASFLNEKLDELATDFQIIDHSKLLTLAAMIITEKYFIEKENNQDKKTKIDDISLSLSAFLSENKL